MRNPLHGLNLPLHHKFLLGIVLVVVPVMGIVFTWMGLRSQSHTIAQIVNQARVLCRQVILTRQWISDCGGVMVAADSDGARGTHYFYDDHMDTERGRFQRFSPSMVTKKMSDYSLRENMYQLRLASLTPMNPDNLPDDFEKAALSHFVHDRREEFYQLGMTAAAASFRYAVPLYVEDTCLKCHADQGFTKGSIGGTLSVRFPAKPIAASIRTDRYRLIGAGAGMIALTLLMLLFLVRTTVVKPLKALETMADEISTGNLAARVAIHTGDEFERLGKTFNHMGARLSQHREIMEEKIALATRQLSQANVELQQLDRLKTDFFADMSHEMRSPITAIQGGVDYLKRTMQRPDNLDYLNIIDKNLLRLTHLVSDLLDLTRIEAGKVSWNFEAVDIAELIREVIEILSLKADGEHVTLVYDGSESIVGEIDMERIEQVLVNLLENAIKFSPTGGRIDIQTRVQDGILVVSIEDHGIGIAPENIDRVFEKFHTLPSGGGSGHTKGTGLGLTICRKIVEAHGGRIWVESEAGRGSVFHFNLPLKRSVIARGG
jgi:signal transduction histidine kinase